MKLENEVISQVAAQASVRITRKTIRILQRLRETLSGDDSGLKNPWDEICVQVQREASFSWDAYDDTVRQIVTNLVRELPEFERTAIWLQTEAGWDWAHDDGEARGEPNVFDEDLVDHVISEFVYQEAGRWSNRRIRRCLGEE